MSYFKYLGKTIKWAYIIMVPLFSLMIIMKLIDTNTPKDVDESFNVIQVLLSILIPPFFTGLFFGTMGYLFKKNPKIF
jgi:hypothetical protein